MVSVRVLAGLGLGAVAAAGLSLAPALGAREAPQDRGAGLPMSGIGSFTPASADPKLAAVLSRSGLSGTGFRFTPSDSKKTGNRAVTVAVRARSTRVDEAERLATSAQPAAVSLAPIAYNLGVAVGWKRFAVSGDVTRVDLGTLPGGRESAELGVSYTGKAFSGRVKAGADRPLADTPRLIADAPSYTLDVGGSYRLTRNLDVTAGVRYKTEREELTRFHDDRRDSQAVYVGTAFRF